MPRIVSACVRRLRRCWTKLLRSLHSGIYVIWPTALFWASGILLATSPSPTLLPVTPVPTDTPSMFPTPRPSMAIELNFASLAPRRVFRAYVDIWFVVVPDQTISGLAFRDNDVEQFRQDVSDAYGTMLDRLQLLSLQQTSVAGTKRMRHGSRECPDCSPFSIRSCVSHAPPRFRNVCSPLCSLL